MNKKKSYTSTYAEDGTRHLEITSTTENVLIINSIFMI